ncbi:MAG: hypothetical protein COB66_07270, partial [Coxiella sp. (in: Bacteria)]
MKYTTITKPNDSRELFMVGLLGWVLALIPTSLWFQTYFTAAYATAYNDTSNSLLEKFGENADLCDIFIGKPPFYQNTSVLPECDYFGRTSGQSYDIYCEGVMWVLPMYYTDGPGSFGFVRLLTSLSFFITAMISMILPDSRRYYSALISVLILTLDSSMPWLANNSNWGSSYGSRDACILELIKACGQTTHTSCESYDSSNPGGSVTSNNFFSFQDLPPIYAGIYSAASFFLMVAFLPLMYRHLGVKSWFIPVGLSIARNVISTQNWTEHKRIRGGIYSPGTVTLLLFDSTHVNQKPLEVRLPDTLNLTNRKAGTLYELIDINLSVGAAIWRRSARHESVDKLREFIINKIIEQAGEEGFQIDK